MHIKLPDPLVQTRIFKCRKCDPKDHEFDNPCASCPNGKWGPEFCDEKFQIDENLIEKMALPKIATMAKTLTKSTTQWAVNGFKRTDEETLKNRTEVCQSCEFWNAQAFNNTGRCMKCGCSTWAKLRMATEKCPIGKW